MDRKGNAYVTGVTWSNDFPATGKYGGKEDAFVTKLNSKGSELLYSTYLGKGNMSWGSGVAIDNLHNFYICGTIAYKSDFLSAGFLAIFIAVADLSIEKVAVPDPVLIGSELSYTIRVTNNGPDEAFDVIVSDEILRWVEFISAVSTKGSCNYTSLDRIVTISIGNLEVLETVSITIKVKPLVVGEVENKAIVIFGGRDPNSPNNTAVVKTKVIDLYGEINEILAVIKGTKLTTGPVIRDAEARGLVIAVENTRSSKVIVNITVVDYTVTPSRHNTFPVSIKENSMETLDLTIPPEKYEVIFDGMIEGVYGWTSTIRYVKNGCCCVIKNNFIESNTFRHGNLGAKAKLG